MENLSQSSADFIFIHQIGVALAAFIIGSVPFAIIISKFFKLGDITKFGSGNPGATNMLRFGGKKLAATTLILDALKGAFAVWLGMHIGGPVIAFVFVVLGHCFSLFLNFKGGKGVATAIGALLVLNPHVGLTACVLWLLTFAIFRISSLAALVAMNLAPLKAVIWYGENSEFWAMLFIAALITYRHKSNIKKLLAGTEK